MPRLVQRRLSRQPSLPARDDRGDVTLPGNEKLAEARNLLRHQVLIPREFLETAR